MPSQPQDPAAPDRATGKDATPSTGESAPDEPAAAGSLTRDSEPLKQLAVEDTDQLLQLAKQVGQLHDRIAVKTKSEVEGLFELLGSKRRLMFVNFISGLARGAGFFLGVTLIGGLLIGGLAFFVDTTTAAMGMEDVTFRSLLKAFAEEAIEAKRMWEDVNEEVTATDPAADPDAADGPQSPPAPREDG